MLTHKAASGLYYLSELVEEHSVFSKRLLSRIIYVVIATHVLLWTVDSFPLKLTLLAIVSHVVYLQNLRSFPVVNLTDPFFLASCGMSLSSSARLRRPKSCAFKTRKLTYHQYWCS